MEGQREMVDILHTHRHMSIENRDQAKGDRTPSNHCARETSAEQWSRQPLAAFALRGKRREAVPIVAMESSVEG